MCHEISLLKKGLTLLLCGVSFLIFGQDNLQVQSVFDKLVLAYGSAKSAPHLIISGDKILQISPAKYYPDPPPTIKVDSKLFILCKTFGADSLNALSIVLSHELAHYYSDHTFCSDYAYAIKNKNKSLATILKGASMHEIISKETEADQKGFFYAAAAGFSPYKLQSILLDKIYSEYNLPDSLPGYPTKQAREDIAKEAESKAKELYSLFKLGLRAIEDKNFDKAISDFEQANSYIPYRENYNNLGVAKTLKALQFKILTSEEVHYPKRFLYPLEVDNKSRLNKENTRGVEDDQEEQFADLLKSAQKDFQEAIRLDPDYIEGYINLACIYDLLGNPNNAIGTIKGLAKSCQNTIQAKRILAISYYHNNQETKANIIWQELEE